MWSYIQSVAITILTRYLGRLVASEIYFKHEEYKKEAENKIHDLQVCNAKLNKLNDELTDHIKQLNDEITDRMSVEEKLDSISKSPKKNDWSRGEIAQSDRDRLVAMNAVSDSDNKESNDSFKPSSKSASETDVSSSVSSDSGSSSISSSDGGSSGM